MKLTIGICGLVERLPCAVLDKLKTQQTKDVEIILLFDNRQLTLGAKRNIVLERATGDYIAFVDDDDDISDDYIETLLTASKDVLTFKTAHYIDGAFNKEVVYSTTKGNRNRPDHYIRWANAICCWRTEFARGVGYGDVTFAEDTDFGSRAAKKNPKEQFVNKVLYKHLWSSETSTGEVINSKEDIQFIEAFPTKEHVNHLVYAAIRCDK